MSDVLTVSVTPIRPGDNGPQLFWARRCADRDFLGGFHAYFAGTVESEDDSLRSAALRELVEESGLLVTDDGIQRLGQHQREQLDSVAGSDLFETSRLELLGWWQNPEWMKPTFATAFFALRLSAEEGARLDDLADGLDAEEFDGGQWIDASKAVEQWSGGECFATTPIISIARGIADASDLSRPLPRPAKLGPSRDEPGGGLSGEICGGLTVIPLKTATLPPATHTNCVVAGDQHFAVIDPGADTDDDLRPLIDHLQERIDGGHRCIGVVLTHHHRDHIGGVEAIADLLDTPVQAHPETLARVELSESRRTQTLTDGDTLDIDHPGPLRALHTPGHAPGHLVFFQPHIGVAIGGDLVAGKGTIVIDPPDGDMGDYLESLKRIRQLSPRALLPAHGDLQTAPLELLDDYTSHRQRREEQVLNALGDGGAATARDLVPQVYTDAPEAVWPIATRSLLAHLLHLADKGRVHRDGDEFSIPAHGAPHSE